jgi:hypothetical protein
VAMLHVRETAEFQFCDGYGVRAERIVAERYMVREEELIRMASVYREMQEKARDPRLRLEFADRAERYETAVWALQRAKAPSPGPAKS